MDKQITLVIKIFFVIVGISLIVLCFKSEPANYVLFAPGAIIISIIIYPYVKNKRCSRCGLLVATRSQRGDKCPRCFSVWK
jgi:hypothetical protein